MDFKNIEIQIPMSELTDLQKLHLETANQLISNMFSVSPVKIPKNKFSYDGETFTIINVHAGYLHSFLVEDIHHTIQDNQEKHLDFINNYIVDLFQDFNNKIFKTTFQKDNFIILVETILKYYKSNLNIYFPSYIKTESFVEFLTKLSNDVEKELALIR